MMPSARDRALDEPARSPDDTDPSCPQSGVRAIEGRRAVESGEEERGERLGAPVRPASRWITRLLDACARVLQSARRDPEIRALHDAASVLERDGGVVFADLDGWPRPPVVQGFVPDLYAVFDDREIVLDFVDQDSVARDATGRKDRAFTAWARASTRRVYERILVEGGRGGRGCASTPP
jgi:hypothetical protein